eukprot:jgi/Chlat1/4962/Chrsp32S04946
MDPLSKLRESRGKERPLYRLDAIWFLAKNRQLGHGDYVREASKDRYPLITLLDRKDLLAYLTGEIDASDAIQASAVAAPPFFLGSASTPGEQSKEGLLDLNADADGRQLLEAEAPTVAPADVTSVTVGTRAVLERERRLRDRSSSLVCHRRTFHRVLTLLDLARKDGQQHQHAEDKKRKAAAPPMPPQAMSRYARGHGDDNAFWKTYLKSEDAEALAIDPSGSFVVPGKPEPSRNAPPPPSHPPPSQPRQRTTPIKPTPTKEKVLGPPIIIVPAGYSSLMNMYNIKKFLEEGEFETWNQAKDRGVKKESLVMVLRKMERSKPVPYHIIDNTTKLEKKDWVRVVAVLTQGAAWQFKGWPFKDGLVEIFTKVRGFNFRLDDEKIDPNVATWNVKQLTINRHARHRDSSTVLEFWKILDSFIQSTIVPRLARDKVKLLF